MVCLVTPSFRYYSGRGLALASQDSMVAIGKRLRLIRLANGGSNAVAWARSLDLPRSTWNSWERGERLIPSGDAMHLCDRFGVTMEWIYRDAEWTLPDPVKQKLFAVVVPAR